MRPTATGGCSYEALNRGTKPGFALLNDLPVPVNDFVKASDAGNGFLMNRGYTVVWSGWQGDIVPALRSGKKVVISTATIALQEQLVRKDIPLVVGALGIPARVELLKGRSHYLCRSKLDRMRGERLIAQSATMEAMWDWADRTATGDRAELPFAPPPFEWEALDADADDCVGEFCERFRDCWFFAQRDAAKYADIVVVNHALFFLDLAMGGTLLPPYDYAILDEAHQCERWASAALTATLSASSVNRLMRRVHRNYALPASYDAEIDEAMRGLVQSLAHVPGERYPLAANEPAKEALGQLQQSFYRLENWLYANWQAALKAPPDNAAEAERRRDNVLRGVLAHIATVDRTTLPDDETISWVERADTDSRYEVNSAPSTLPTIYGPRSSRARKASSSRARRSRRAGPSHFCDVRSASMKRRSTSHPHPSIIACKRDSSSRPQIAIRKIRVSRGRTSRMTPMMMKPVSSTAGG